MSEHLNCIKCIPERLFVLGVGGTILFSWEWISITEDVAWCVYMYIHNLCVHACTYTLHVHVHVNFRSLACSLGNPACPYWCVYWQPSTCDCTGPAKPSQPCALQEGGTHGSLQRISLRQFYGFTRACPVYGKYGPICGGRGGRVYLLPQGGTQT